MTRTFNERGELMKRYTILMVSIVILWTGSGYSEPYKIGTLPWVGFSPANVADVKGFWKSYGADVQTILYTSNSEMKTALENKRIHFALDVPGVWVKSFMDGIPIVILAEIEWSTGGDKIILKKGIDINTLKGKPVGVFSESAIMLLHRFLKDKNLKFSDFQIIELDPESLANNFISNRFQMIVCYDPQASRSVQEGNGEVVATSATYPGSISDCIATHADVLKNIPKNDVINILKGWIDAVKWIYTPSNWNEYKTILNTKTFAGFPPYSEDELKNIVTGVKILDARLLFEQNKDDGGLVSSLKELRTILELNGLLKKQFTPQDIFDNRFIMEVLQQIQYN